MGLKKKIVPKHTLNSIFQYLVPPGRLTFSPAAQLPTHAAIARRAKGPVRKASWGNVEYPCDHGSLCGL